MNPIPSDFGLPQEGFRQGQFEMAEAIANSRERVVVVEGPPGSGKSVVAIVAAQLWGGAFTPTNIVTQTKQLQRQYEEYGVSRLSTIWGRSGYPCKRLGGTWEGIKEGWNSCDGAPCTTNINDGQWNEEEGACILKTEGGCWYYDAKYKALDNALRVLNYYYFMATAGEFGAYSGGQSRAMLICDESHLAEGAILSAAEANIAYKTLARLGLPHPDTMALGRWAAETLKLLNQKRRMCHLEGNWKGVAQMDRLYRHVLNVLYRGEKIVEDLADRLRVRPVWGANYANEYLFDHAKRVVLMSATPGSDWFIKQTLGLDVGERLVMDSIFPTQNRPCLVWPIAGLSHKSTEEDKRKAFRVWDWIVSRYEGKGLLHVSSYRLAQDYAAATAFPGRVISHTSKETATTIRDFVDGDASRGRVLVSPVVGTGFDCDQLSFQIVGKIPYPDLGDKVVVARKEDLPGTYAGQTALNVVQMYGRAVRNETWRGDTWVTDANIVHLLKGQKAMFSRYFTEAVQWVRGDIPDGE